MSKLVKFLYTGLHKLTRKCPGSYSNELIRNIFAYVKKSNHRNNVEHKFVHLLFESNVALFIFGLITLEQNKNPKATRHYNNTNSNNTN